MKTKKIILKSTFLLLLSLGVASCSDDFLDVNDNPNDPPISTPSLTLPVAQQTFAALNGTSMVYLGQFMMYNWAVPSNWSAQGDLIRYNVTSNFYTNIFETSYASIFRDLRYVENYVDPTGAVDYSAYNVMAQTIKGFQYQYLVDLYGDVPYTEANLRGENTTPVYDDAETIYKAVIDSLSNAAVLALDLPENAENPGAQDIIFHGDMHSWAQFANSVKLRMLIRLSDTGQDQYIKDQINMILANGAGFIEHNVVANPGYSDNAGQQNPFYGYVGFGPNDAALDRRDYTVATDFIIETLTGFDDPRLGRLYSPSKSGGNFKGAPQSTALPGSGFTSNDLSHVGPGLLTSSEQDQPIMLESEVLFLLSEAALRGYIDGGEALAQELYEMAIAESFEYLGVESPDESAEEYYSQTLENVSWEASSNKLEAIITQKWIALNGTSSIESWIEWIRTGYPDNLPIPEESNGVRPVSLLYPLSEIGRNSENVPPQTQDDAFTNYPFWAVNN
jgi:hypothetical protein